MKNKLYKGRILNDLRDLVSLYKNEYKSQIAFEYKKEPNSTEYIRVDYSTFAHDIETLGANLLHLGSKRVAIISDNRYEWCVSYLAITTAGLVVVPFDKSLPDNEIESLIIRSHADTIIYASKYADAAGLCKNKICMDDASFIDMLKNAPDESITDYNNLKIDNKAMSVMLFTSGTTSTSKAVMLSQYALCTDMYGLSQMIDINPSDKFLSFLPLHHTFESGCTFLFGTSCGITIAFCDGLKHIQKNLIEYQITAFVCVPLMLEIMYKKIYKTIDEQHKTILVNIMRRLFRHSSIKTKRRIFKSIIDGLGGKLKIIISGGAAISRDVLQGYNDFGFDIHQGYGLTETASVLAGENILYKRNGSVGFPLPTVEFKINNPDKNGIGEILAKTDSIMLGYYENEDATNEVLKDGWFYTGDLGYIDKDGFLFITGRKKDMIVLKNGKKIFPEELEALINKLPFVSESMVFGNISNTKADRCDDVVLCAKIVFNKDKIKELFPKLKVSEYPNMILNEVKTKVNKLMPAYKYIRKITVTDIPLIKTTTQKIKRHEEMKLIKDMELI